MIFWIQVNTIIMFCDNKSDSLAYIFSINKYYWHLSRNLIGLAPVVHKVDNSIANYPLDKSLSTAQRNFWAQKKSCL